MSTVQMIANSKSYFKWLMMSIAVLEKCHKTPNEATAEVLFEIAAEEDRQQSTGSYIAEKM